MMNGGNVYGQGYQYGWQDGGQQRSDGVVLPLAPQRRSAECHDCYAGCPPINWHTFGILLGFLAAATCALGVADVVLTYQTYMVTRGCLNSPGPGICDPNTLVFTWVGVGIWASIPVFMLAITSIRNSNHVGRHGCWEFLAFVSAFIFTPAMVILSAIEAFKGAGVYYWPYMSPLTMDDQAKAALPITIAVVGFIEHIMAAIALWSLCCCPSGHASTATYGMSTMEQAVMPLPAPAPAMIRSSCNTCPQQNYTPRAQMFPASTSCNSCAQGPKFSGSFYSGNAGLGGRPWSGVNNWSNMRPTSVINTAGQGGWSAPIQPNSAYSFYNR